MKNPRTNKVAYIQKQIKNFSDNFLVATAKDWEELKPEVDAFFYTEKELEKEIKDEEVLIEKS